MNKTESRPLTPHMYAELLPGFVKQALQDIIGGHARRESFTEGQLMDIDLARRLADSRYAEVSGALDAAEGNLDKVISFGIGGRDAVLGFIHIGGTNCWLLPDGHMIGFTAIAPELLPSRPDRNTWWVITCQDETEGCTIIKITVRPEHEVHGAFPEIG